MDFDNIKSVIRQNIVPILLGMFGIILVIFGLFQILVKNQNKGSLELESASEGLNSAKEEFIIDVEGAVIKPGVYSLPSKARIVDALAAAGGLSEDADRDYVEKNINMAKKVADGLKIYIPRLGESVVVEGASTGSSSNSVLNINTAGQADLEALPGIGPVTARKIIEGRPYADINDLTSKKIIGSKLFGDIKNSIAAN